METKKLIEATCPECRGPMSEVRETNAVTEYCCLVGHRYSARALLEAHSETQERSLWSAVVALEEAAKMVRAVAPEFPPEIADRLRDQSEKKQRQADEVRALLQDLDPFVTE